MSYQSPTDEKINQRVHRYIVTVKVQFEVHARSEQSAVERALLLSVSEGDTIGETEVQDEGMVK